MPDIREEQLEQEIAGLEAWLAAHPHAVAMSPTEVRMQIIHLQCELNGLKIDNIKNQIENLKNK